MKALKEVSDALAATVEKSGQSVVRVEARRRLPASGIVLSPDGVVVTAHHIVQHDENIQLGLPDGEKVPATLVGRDPTTDLAVLRADVTGLTPPDWADREDLRVGHMVLALGRPGRKVMATLGIMSAIDDKWRTPAGGELDQYLQTDVVMYPGFSGGLLVNSLGEGVGLNTSGLMRGISIAVPYESLRLVAQILLEHGSIRRGFLGVSVQPVQLPVGLAEQLNQETGLLLMSVEPGGPAAVGSLVLGDAIVSLADQPVRQMDDLIGHLSGDRVGEEVTVRIVRSGKVKDIKITIGERK